MFARQWNDCGKFASSERVKEDAHTQAMELTAVELSSGE